MRVIAKADCLQWVKGPQSIHKHSVSQGNIHRGLWAILPPKYKKESWKKKGKNPENCHRLQCKSLLSVADSVGGLWKVTPQNEKLFLPCSEPSSKMVAYLWIMIKTNSDSNVYQTYFFTNICFKIIVPKYEHALYECRLHLHKKPRIFITFGFFVESC